MAPIPRTLLDPWLAVLLGAPSRPPELDPLVLHEAQLRGLRRTLSLALRRSRFYAGAFAALPGPLREAIGRGLWPDHAEDLSLLPFTLPGHMAETGPGGFGWRDFLCVSQDEIARMVTLRSSGTSGPEKRLAFSADDLTRSAEFFSVGLGLVARPGECLLVLLPGADRVAGVADLILRAMPWLGYWEQSARRPGWADFFPQGLAERGRKAHHTADTAAALLAPVPGGPRARGAAGDPSAEPRSFLDSVRACSPRSLVAAPWQLRRLIASPEVNALAAGPQGIRRVLCSGETLDPALRRLVEEAWGCEIFDHYGLTESGYGLGVECAAHDGYHLREAEFWLEIVDAEGRPSPPGQEGEIVLTTLTRRAMPLIRYRTGDVAAWLTEPCPCGSLLRRLGPVRGRLGPDGRVVNPAKGGGSRA